MKLGFFVIVLLRVYLATAANFTQVFEWNEFDYEWPSEESRNQALQDGTFKPESIEPRFMAVYGTRLFLSFEKHINNSVTLVSLPTSSASSEPPKLTPFPSFDMHDQKMEDCTKIQAARGLEVDALGRLWVLDNGSNNNCSAKLRIYNLENNDELELEHEFPFRFSTNDLVLDLTPHGYVAYIARWKQEHIVIFNFTAKRSCFLNTKGIKWDGSIALAPKSNPRELYISKLNSPELFSISVKDRTIKPIGRWTASPTRMLIDTNGTLYAAFWSKHHIAMWDTSQKFQENLVHELKVGSQDNNWPFSFALDSSGILWMTELNKTGDKPKYRLLKAEVGARSYVFEYPSAELPDSVCEETSTTEVHQYRLFIITLICSNVFGVVLLSLIILWLVLKLKRKNSVSPTTNEAQQMSVFRNNHEVQYSRNAAGSSVPAEYDDVGAAEVPLYEEVKDDQVAARSPAAPSLYERPIILSPRSARRVKAMPERQRTFEKFGEAPLPPVEYDDVGPPEPEPLYAEVKPEPSRSPHRESVQYLKILP